MRQVLLLILLPGVAVASASLSPPPVTGPAPIEVDRPAGPRLSPTPLTREEAVRLRQRLRESLEAQAAMAPKSEALREAGLPESSDAVERATAARSGTIGPIEIGLAEVLPRAPRETVDPGLAKVTRSALRSRLGREPSSAEFDGELRAFDARVERVNQWLADHRVEIAKAVESKGSLPRSIDANPLGLDPADPQISSAPASEGFRALFRSLLTEPDDTASETPRVNPPDLGPPVTSPGGPASRPTPETRE